MYTHLCYFVCKVTQDVHTLLLLSMGSHTGCPHTSATLYEKSHSTYTYLCYYGKSHSMYTHLYLFVWKVTQEVQKPLLLCMGSHTGCKHRSAILCGKAHRYTHTSATLYGKSHWMYTHLYYFVGEVTQNIHTPLKLSMEVTQDVHTPLLLCMWSHTGCTHNSVTVEVTLYIHTPLSLYMGSHKGCTHTSTTLYGKSHIIYTHLYYFI